MQWNFNPRSPRGERRKTVQLWRHILRISIHAPLAGSDGMRISPIVSLSEFQSTLPSRGATFTAVRRAVLHIISIHAPLAGSVQTMTVPSSSSLDFNPRSPRGERLEASHTVRIIFISIHAPLAGSDILSVAFTHIQTQFQSTLPSRGATKIYCPPPADLRFQSTLPSRGATSEIDCRVSVVKDFNPRSPRGERH